MEKVQHLILGAGAAPSRAQEPPRSCLPAPPRQELTLQPRCVQVMAEPSAAQGSSEIPALGEERPLMLALDTGTGESQPSAVNGVTSLQQHLLQVLFKHLPAATHPSVKYQGCNLTSTFVQQLQLRLLCRSWRSAHPRELHNHSTPHCLHQPSLAQAKSTAPRLQEHVTKPRSWEII